MKSFIKIFRRLTTPAFLFFFLTAALAQQDSARTQKMMKVDSRNLTTKVSLSSSYSTYNNWSAGNHNNFCFQANGDVSYAIRKKKFRQKISLRTALSYVNYVDSLWIKAADY